MSCLPSKRPEARFQPVVDTGGENDFQRLLGHQYLPVPAGGETGREAGGDASGDGSGDGSGDVSEVARVRRIIRAVAGQDRESLYFAGPLPSEFCLFAALDELEEAGMLPSNLAFEVSGRDMTRDPAGTRRVAELYGRRGFGISLEGAGTGPSSLRMVLELRPDYIRLPGSVTSNLEHPMHAAGTRRLVELAEEIGVTVVAKGVTRTQSMENLWLLGVRYMQGPLFGEPSAEISRPGHVLINLFQALDPSDERSRAAALSSPDDCLLPTQ